MSQFSQPPRHVPITDEKGIISQIWFKWFVEVANALSPGVTETIATAKLTGGGANGEMVFAGGKLTDSTPAT